MSLAEPIVLTDCNNINNIITRAPNAFKMSQAWQVHQNIKNASRHSPEALANLELHNVAKPVPGAKRALVRIRAGLREDVTSP